MSIPYAQIEQKAGVKGLDVEEIKVLYELAKKAKNKKIITRTIQYHNKFKKLLILISYLYNQ